MQPLNTQGLGITGGMAGSKSPGENRSPERRTALGGTSPMNMPAGSHNHNVGSSAEGAHSRSGSVTKSLSRRESIVASLSMTGSDHGVIGSSGLGISGMSAGWKTPTTPGTSPGGGSPLTRRKSGGMMSKLTLVRAPSIGKSSGAKVGTGGEEAASGNRRWVFVT